ncbi:hypothetical protein MMC29_001326 [Sticta canariensis]|nr:hypothetical protein [Sticta canariensis]
MVADIKAGRPPLTMTGLAPGKKPTAQPATLVNMSPLTLDEVKEFKMQSRTYMQEMPKYNRQITVMRSLPITIQETISHTYLFYTLKCNTAYEMLRALKKRVAPSYRVRLIELSNPYQKPGRELASQQWVKTYKEGQKLGLPEVINEAASVHMATSFEYNPLTESVSSAQPTLQAFPEEAAIVELCSEVLTEVEPLRDSKIIECKAAAVRNGHESHDLAIQIDGHCPGDMPPKTTEIAGLLTASETPIKCRQQKPCQKVIQPVSSSQEIMIKDVEILICRQDRKTSFRLEKDSETRISEEEAEPAIKRLAVVDRATKRFENVMITKGIIEDLQTVIQEPTYLNRIRTIAIKLEKWSTEGHLIHLLKGFDLDSTRQQTEFFQRMIFDPGG